MTVLEQEMRGTIRNDSLFEQDMLNLQLLLKTMTILGSKMWVGLCLR